MIVGHALKYKWYCQCVMESGERVYLVATAATEIEASRIVHMNYAIDYVEDIRTPDEMDRHTSYLRPTLIGVAQMVPWWSSSKSTPAKSTHTKEAHVHGNSITEGVS